MTIEELELLHLKEYLKSSPVNHVKEHTKISIEFTIEVLNDIINGKNYEGVMNSLRYKVQDLKQNLNGSK